MCMSTHMGPRLCPLHYSHAWLCKRELSYCQCISYMSPRMLTFAVHAIERLDPGFPSSTYKEPYVDMRCPGAEATRIIFR